MPYHDTDKRIDYSNKVMESPEAKAYIDKHGQPVRVIGSCGCILKSNRSMQKKPDLKVKETCYECSGVDKKASSQAQSATSFMTNTEKLFTYHLIKQATQEKSEMSPGWNAAGAALVGPEAPLIYGGAAGGSEGVLNQIKSMVKTPLVGAGIGAAAGGALGGAAGAASAMSRPKMFGSNAGNVAGQSVAGGVVGGTSGAMLGFLIGRLAAPYMAAKKHNASIAKPSKPAEAKKEKPAKPEPKE